MTISQATASTVSTIRRPSPSTELAREAQKRAATRAPSADRAARRRRALMARDGITSASYDERPRLAIRARRGFLLRVPDCNGSQRLPAGIEVEDVAHDVGAEHRAAHPGAPQALGGELDEQVLDARSGGHDEHPLLGRA